MAGHTGVITVWPMPGWGKETLEHFLPIGDTCGIHLQRDIWGLDVEREAASVNVQCLHFAPMIRVELLSDFLQEAGEGTDPLRIHPSKAQGHTPHCTAETLRGGGPERRWSALPLRQRPAELDELFTDNIKTHAYTQPQGHTY